MRRAKLGVAVILSTGLLAACDAPSPPAGTVVRDAAPATTIIEGMTPATTEPPVSLEVPPETTTTTTESEPEPTVYVVPSTVYVPPVPKRTTTTEVYEPPSPQSRTVRGDTPPEYIKQCESGGSYTAVNPNGHYGAWQFSQSTWESVGGTGRPDQASPAEQDKRAAILWANGAGASHWSCA